MKQDWERLGPAGLEFFGAISASLSHELKNSLAIINENAGLMQDFLHMAAQGKPLDPERLASSLSRIQRHVETANEVIGSLNRFAHLTDEPRKRVDPVEEVALALRLHRRQAGRAGVEFAMGETQGERPAALTTMPFLFCETLHLVLHALMDAAEGRLEVRVEDASGGTKVLFSGEFADLAPPGGVQAEALFRAVGAELVPGSGRVELFFRELD